MYERAMCYIGMYGFFAEWSEDPSIVSIENYKVGPVLILSTYLGCSAHDGAGG